MAAITLDIAAFRVQFPAFANVLTYPDATIQMYFDMSSNTISTNDVGYLRGMSRTLALYLMSCHLLKIADGIASGTPVQAMQSASEGSVSIGFITPPLKNRWQWWLSATPYGQQLLAMLEAIAVGGLYIGGSFNRAGFRKPNGSF